MMKKIICILLLILLVGCDVDPESITQLKEEIKVRGLELSDLEKDINYKNLDIDKIKELIVRENKTLNDMKTVKEYIKMIEANETKW